MARSKLERYIVTGPGLDPEPSYEHPGPALSRALTAALHTSRHAKGVEATFYARDSISGDPVGYAETDGDGNVIVKGVS